MPSLDEWLAYQSQVHPQAIDLGLARLNRVLDRLRWRRPPVPVITIAGTNGKGSVAADCGAILSAAGLRVGAFTSPHLRDYRERIRIQDRTVDAGELIAAFERIEAARGDQSLTFFEYNTLAALLVLDAAQLDAWVLEVGLGGRLDAVNVVDPDVAVVVSIGFDHQEFLGPTLEDIGREKAGIFRPGRPAVLGSRTLPPVMERSASAIGAPVKRLGIEFDYTRQGVRWHYRGNRWNLPELPAPALFGDIQYDNAATAIAAIEELAGATGPLRIPAAAVADGLRSVHLAGRFQMIPGTAPSRPTWILDVAHNPEAARVLSHNLRALPPGGRNLGICGILADKDAVSIVNELRDSIDAWWFVSTHGDRGRSGAALAAQVADRLTAPVMALDRIADACAAALGAASGLDRVVIFGSFHTVGPALDWLAAGGLLHTSPLGEADAAPPGL